MAVFVMSGIIKRNRGFSFFFFFLTTAEMPPAPLPRKRQQSQPGSIPDILQERPPDGLQERQGVNCMGHY